MFFFQNCIGVLGVGERSLIDLLTDIYDNWPPKIFDGNVSGTRRDEYCKNLIVAFLSCCYKNMGPPNHPTPTSNNPEWIIDYKLSNSSFAPFLNVISGCRIAQNHSNKHLQEKNNYKWLTNWKNQSQQVFIFAKASMFIRHRD